MARDRADDMALEFVERIMDVRDERTLITEMSCVMAPFGVEWFAIAQVPEPLCGAGILVRISALPPGWKDRYFAAGYYGVDPIARHARRTTEPFLWSEALWDRAHDLPARDMMADAEAFGLRNGLTVPIVSANREQELVTLAGGFKSLTAQSRRILQLISIYAHHRACEIAPLSPLVPPIRGIAQ